MLRWFLLVFILVAVLFVGLAGKQGEKFKSRPIMVFNDMDHQYKLKFQRQSDFFADGSAARKPVSGTIPMGYGIPEKPVAEGGKAIGQFSFGLNDYYSTGMIGDYFGVGLPKGMEATPELLERGRERFGIYCAVCHGHSGNGKGIFGQYIADLLTDEDKAKLNALSEEKQDVVRARMLADRTALQTGANLIDDDVAGRKTLDGQIAPLGEGQVFYTITNGKGAMGPYGANIPIDDRWAIAAYVRALRLSQNADLNDPEIEAAFKAAVEAAKLEPETPAAAENDGDA